MAAAAETAATGKIGELPGGTAGDEVAIAIGEAEDGVGVTDVDPLGIRAVGVEGDAEGLVETGGEDGDLPGFAGGVDAAEDFDFAGFAFGEEEIAVGGEADEARIVETGGVELDLEALGRDGPGVGGARNDVGAVVDGLLGCRGGQVSGGEVAASAGRFVSRVSECGLACEEARAWVGCLGAGLAEPEAKAANANERTEAKVEAAMRRRGGIMEPRGGMECAQERGSPQP